MLLAAGALIGAPANAAAPASTVSMTKEAFVPEKLEVAAGTTITWINNDDMPHSVTANDGQFDSGPIQPDKRYQWIAKGTGTIEYHCIFHPSMTATVTVNAKP
jgi:plastocyanin